MRRLWADANNDCDWAKAAAHGMTGIYYPISDPIADVRRRLNDTRAHNLQAGVYMASNWAMFAGKSGTSGADLMHSLTTSASPNAAVKVQFDIEHSAFASTAECRAYVLECLTRWRALRPTQDTSWTVECFQGGWMDAAFVDAIVNKLRVRVVPQMYRHPASGKDMADPTDYKDLITEQVAQDVALKDLLSRGFPYQSISSFYDAAYAPYILNPDGFFFTQGRLP